MNWYYIALQAMKVLFFSSLLLVPFGYCVIKGNFKKGFWFTWILWSIVWFLFSLCLPAIGYLTVKATGESPDISCGGFVIGIVFGWLPGLIFASVGEFLHNVFMNVFIRKNSN